MAKTTEEVKNELTGLQYSIDQIQLSKINIDLAIVSSTQKATGQNNNFFNDSEKDELNGFLNHIDEVKKIDEEINNQLDDYLELFPPNQQSDFHYMLDALQSFIEWSEDYSKWVKSFEKGEGSGQKLKEFETSSEFVSLCCNWLSSTVSTVLKYGFGGSERETV